MKASPNRANWIASQTVESVMDNFHYQLKAKDAIKVLPEYLFRQASGQTNHIVSVGGLPRP
jgi:hypothetical protein